MNDHTSTLNDLKKLMAQFVHEREWQKYHTPKNLSMSIAIEAAELMEIFQWVSEQDSQSVLERNREEISNELADIFSYIVSFCNLYNIDLACALENKLKINAKKYPIEKVKGSYENYLEVKKSLKKDVK